MAESRPNGKVKIPQGYTLAELMRIKFPEPRWAVPNILAHGLTVLGGLPKAGKSWLCLNLGLAVSLGGKALGQIDCEQGRVLYLCLEDDWPSMQERATIVHPGMTFPDNFHVYNEWPRMGREQGTRALGEWLDDHPDTRLVMIDTLTALRPQVAQSSTLYADDYNVSSALKHVGDQHRCSILATTHLTKLARDDPFQMFNATLGLTGGSDAMIVLAAGAAKYQATMHIKGRRVRWQELAMSWSADTATWTLLGKAEDNELTRKRNEVIKLLTTSPMPLSAREIAQMLGWKEANTRQLLWQMKQAGLVGETEGKYRATAKPVTRPISQSANNANNANTTPETSDISAVSQLQLVRNGQASALTETNNPVSGVSDVSTVRTVRTVRDFSGHATDIFADGELLVTGMKCLGCEAVLPHGWTHYCPICEEKREAEERMAV